MTDNINLNLLKDKRTLISALIIFIGIIQFILICSFFDKLVYLKVVDGIFTILVCALTVTLVFVNDMLKIEYQYLMVGLTFGVIFSFMIPAFTVPDEISHYITSYSVSNHIMGIKDDDGIKMRENDFEFTKKKLEPDYSREKYNGYWKNISAKDNEKMIETNKTRLSSASFQYYPSAIGMTIGRLVGGSAYICFSLGRLFNVIIGCFIVFSAVKIIPVYKEFWAVVALFPMFIQQQASYSYDCILNATVVLSLALFFKAGREDSSDKKSWITYLGAILSAIVVAMCKGHSYFLFLILPLAIIALNFLKKTYRVLLIELVGFGCCILGIKFLLQYDLDALVGVKSRTYEMFGMIGYTLNEILANPLSTIVIMLRTVYKQGLSLAWDSVGRSLGWLDHKIPFVIIIGFVVLAIISMLDEKNKEYCVTLFEKVQFFVIILGEVFIVFMMLMLDVTPRSYPVILGLQGRYFVTLLPMGLLLFYTRRKSIKFSSKWLLLVEGGLLNLTILSFVLK